MRRKYEPPGKVVDGFQFNRTGGANSGWWSVGDVERLAGVERRDRVLKADAPRLGDPSEFLRGVGAAHGDDTVGGGDAREERHNKRAEERERERVADEVDQEESAA